MSYMGQFGAGFNTGLHADAHLNAHAGLGVGAAPFYDGGYGYGGYGYGEYSSTGAILVLFILLVIISRTILI